MAEPAATRPGNRGLKIALVASLGVNLIVAGLVGGAMLGHRRHPPPPTVVDLSFGPYNDALTPEDRLAIRQAFADRAPDMREIRKAARGDFDQLLGLLRSGTWDPAAAAAMMTQQEDRASRGFRIGHELILERLNAMTGPERLAFADRLEYALDHPPKPHRGKVFGPGPGGMGKDGKAARDAD